MGNCKSIIAVNFKSHFDDNTKNGTGTGTGTSAIQRVNANTYKDLPPTCDKFLVTKVYDGDTMTVEDGTRVRLLGIDTPEINKKQPYALEAKQLLAGYCLDRDVYLSYEDGGGGNKGTSNSNGSNDGRKDRYGRSLAWVWIKQKNNMYLNVNEELVASGLASIYNPSKIKFRNWNALISYQQVARDKRIGKWDSYRNVKVLKTRNGRCYHSGKDCSYLSKTKSHNLISVVYNETMDNERPQSDLCNAKIKPRITVSIRIVNAIYE